MCQLNCSRWTFLWSPLNPDSLSRVQIISEISGSTRSLTPHLPSLHEPTVVYVDRFLLLNFPRFQPNVFRVVSWHGDWRPLFIGQIVFPNVNARQTSFFCSVDTLSRTMFGNWDSTFLSRFFSLPPFSEPFYWPLFNQPINRTKSQK